MAEPPRDWLIGPTTYRKYAANWFLGGLGAVPTELLARVEEGAAQVEAKLQPGDELWEWHQRGGPFSSSGGLAILRGDVVVEWWRMWVS